MPRPDTPDATDAAGDDDGHFDEAVAAGYDSDPATASAGGVDPVVDLLADLAREGPVLEFAVGTGRIALPLSLRGLQVAGIDLSRAMVARMRSKEGGIRIPVTIGDIATTRIPGAFSLVYLVFNTINNLTSQDAQVACFANAAAHLQPGGRFVVEVGVPPLQRLPVGQTLLAFSRSDRHWGMDEFDVVTQAFTSHHLTIGDDGSLRRTAIPFRYAWPAELDLMARLAGLVLESRWGGWERQPFTSVGDRHVSVWRKPATPVSA